MNNRYIIILSFVILFGYKAKAQEINFSDSIGKIIEEDTLAIPGIMRYDAVDRNIYDRIYKILRINDPSFYIGVVPYNSYLIDTAGYNLSKAEGSKGTLIEINLAQRFNILKFRPSKNKHFWRMMRLTVDVDFMYRLVKSDETSTDSPGLPLNTKGGFTLERPIIIGNKYDAFTINDSIKGFDTNQIKNSLQLLIPKIRLMHYSNGQDEGALDTLNNRNDYSNGNFSTNFLLYQLDYTVLTKNNFLANAWFGYRSDLPLGKTFSFEKDQNERYGKKRIVYGIHIRSKPFFKGSVEYIPSSGYNKKYILLKKEMALSQKSDSIKIKKEKLKIEKRYMFEVWGKLSIEQILDETKKLPSHRTAFMAEVGVSPLTYRTTSFMLKYYYGRDYLNIRYDLPVSFLMVAVTMNLNKYRPSFVSTKVIK